VYTFQGRVIMLNNNKKPTYIEKRRSVRIRRSKLLNQSENIEYKIATTTDEIEQALELVTQQYISVGLHKEDCHLRLTKYHLLPDSKIFIAIKKLAGGKEKVIGTLTMITDSSMGLPMDEIYLDKLNRLRITGLLLAEVIGLATSPSESALQNNIVMYLFKICLQYAQLCRINELMCSVTKKHITFYEELLLFKPIGELSAYSFANGLPIQGHRLNLQQADSHFKEVYSGMEFDANLHRFFFTDTPTYNRPFGEGEAMSPDQIRYFIETRTQLLSLLSNKDKCILRKEYIDQKKKFGY